jgi:hypothetical protein
MSDTLIENQSTGSHTGVRIKCENWFKKKEQIKIENWVRFNPLPGLGS